MDTPSPSSIKNSTVKNSFLSGIHVKGTKNTSVIIKQNLIEEFAKSFDYFASADYGGIYTENVDTLISISENLIRNDSLVANGINARGSNPKIFKNTINKVNYGISLFSNRNEPLSPVITENTIRGVGTAIAIYLSMQPVINFNNLDANNHYGINNDGPHEIDARYNWWGTDPTAQMESTTYPVNIDYIYDYFEESQRGIVNYQNWLSGEVDSVVAVAPVITTQPVNQTVNSGGTAVFNLLATCNDPIGYQWYKLPGDVKLVDGNNIRGATDNELQIEDVSETENGTSYYCKVYNTADEENLSVNSITASLTVNVSSQIIVADIQVDSVWYDGNYDGVELGVVDGSNSSVNTGSIVSYVWKVDNDTVGYGVSPTIELKSGTNTLTLIIETDLGSFGRTSEEVSVYAAKLETSGSILSSVSWLDNKTLFISSTDDKIYRFDSTGTSSWTILTGGSIQSTICVSDENNIYVGSTDTRLYAFDHLGTPRWDKAMGGIIVSSPSLGQDNSVILALTSGRLFSVSQAGVIKWSAQVEDAIISSPSVSEDLIYFGSTDNKIYAVSSIDGSIAYSYTTLDSVVSSPALGKDSSVIIGANDGYLYKLDKELNVLWKYYTLGKIKSSPVIDESGNIYIGSGSGFVYALSKDKELLWKYNAGSPVNGNPSLGSDGTVYIGCDDGRLLVLTREGELKWHLQTDAPVIASALITENDLIYIGGTDGNVYIIKDPTITLNKTGSDFAFQWPTYKGNNKRTGLKEGISTDVKKIDTNPPNNFSLGQNFPNPFNPSTVINYALPEKSNVKIEVFNMIGQSVALLVDTEKSSGFYEVTWSASDLPSGIYFISIIANGMDSNTNFRQVKKAILLK